MDPPPTQNAEGSSPMEVDTAELESPTDNGNNNNGNDQGNNDNTDNNLERLTANLAVAEEEARTALRPPSAAGRLDTIAATHTNPAMRSREMIHSASLPMATLTAAMSNDFHPAAMSMLDKGWEYVNDAKRFFKDSQSVMDNTTSVSDAMMMEDPDGFLPIALRHTHSTPLQKAPWHLHANESLSSSHSALPPAIPLGPFQRSSSLPSPFRMRSVGSAFGSVRSEITANTEDTTGSLVGVQYISESEVDIRCSAFDPIQYYARQLEDMAVQEDMERTSIEVTDTMTMAHPKDAAAKRRPKRGAAVAERFLANVRGLGRLRRGRSGRENPIQPSSTRGLGDDGDDNSTAAGPQTTVTIVTEAESLANGSNMSRSSELSDILKEGKPDSDPEESERPTAPQYQQLGGGSDVDEEDVQYQRIEASLQAESPRSVPSPTYLPMVDDRPTTQAVHGDRITVQISGKKTPPATAYSSKENTSPMLTTPVPTRVPQTLESTLSVRSNDEATESPQTARSSNTGSSIGHTTHATSCSSGQQSNLTTISETDREVMLANKEGKRRRGLHRLPMLAKTNSGAGSGGSESINSSSTNSNSTSTNPHGYLALQCSPDPREGANVATDRFFTDDSGPSQTTMGPRVHSEGSSTRRSGRSNSPVTDGSSSMTHTSSSSSSREEPPTFVSYLDRKNASDLTSTREEMETCVTRSDGLDNEEREGSPADFVGYQSLYFEEGELAPKPVRPPSRPEKFRTRPPRSPVKGSRMITTPPPCRNSPLYQQLSPPRHIVDHPHHNLSQPYVLRTSDSGKNFHLVGESGAVEGEEAPERMHGVTYEENSIEIMKSDSKDDLMPLNVVTPDK